MFFLFLSKDDIIVYIQNTKGCRNYWNFKINLTMSLKKRSILKSITSFYNSNKNWQLPFQNDTNDKKIKSLLLRNCQSLEVPKATRKLKVMCHSKWHPWTEKQLGVKIEAIWEFPWVSLTGNTCFYCRMLLGSLVGELFNKRSQVSQP